MEQEKIRGIKQVGEKIAASVVNFFNDPQNIRTLEELKALGLTIENPDYETKERAEKPLEGLTFVITGTLPKPRKEVETLIESLGGRVSSSISKSTHYLVVGGDPGSKLQRAEALGVRRITYEELAAMAGLEA